MPKKFNKKGTGKSIKGAESHMYSHTLGNVENQPNSPLSRRLVRKADKKNLEKIKKNLSNGTKRNI